MNILTKCKRWFRTNYLKLKYKFNWNTGSVIILKQGDRQLGLTTMMLEDCFFNNYKLFVPTYQSKHYALDILYHYLSNLLCETDQQRTLLKQNMRKEYLDMFICPNDITTRKYAGKDAIKIIVDNACTIDSIQVLYDAEFYDTDIEIVNGFVYAPYLKF